jgi:porin
MKFRPVFAFVLFLAAVNLAWADTTAPSEGDSFGGPTSIGSELQLDDESPAIRDLEAWFSFKRELREETGFDFSLDYAVLYQQADTSLTSDDNALGGVFRAYGKWQLLGRGTPDVGSIIWKGEHRGSLGNHIAPTYLNDQIGYVGPTGMGFLDEGWFLTSLYWEQFLCDGNVALVAGRLFSFDFVDVSGYPSLWLRFQNGSLSYNGTIPYRLPGMGAGAGVRLTDQWFLGGTLHDANGEFTEYDFLVDGSEFFKQAYVSWAPTRAQRFDRRANITIWHVDERSGPGIDEGWGLAFSGNWLFDGGWMPFTRAGWADGQAARADASLVVGTLYRPDNEIGELGLAWGWESLAAPGLGEQQATEVFFRYDVLPNFAVTPSLQVLIDPALNPSHDTVVVGGLRARVNF